VPRLRQNLQRSLQSTSGEHLLKKHLATLFIN
jgi:hypothetical protein